MTLNSKTIKIKIPNHYLSVKHIAILFVEVFLYDSLLGAYEKGRENSV